MTKPNTDFLHEMKQVMDLLGREGQEGKVERISAVDQKPYGKTISMIKKIQGDASTRHYYRISSGDKNYIAMHMEVFSEHGSDLPFLTVQRHLAEAGVDVPQILDMDPNRGYILLEDLGDVTLLRRLQEVSTSDVERHLYERVLDSLIQLQVYASPDKKASAIDAYKLRFDHEKLMWEMNFTLEHFYTLHLKRQISDRDKKIMMDGLSDICTQLANEPTVLAHRDFHSRNIMVSPADESRDDRLVMIDFQDARMGPAQYDLVSLLKDSYYQLEETQIHLLLQYYIARYEAASGKQLQQDHFHMIFDLMSIQRNFKAIGSFASFMNRRGNPSYLKYIGNTFENIRKTLLKYPQYSALREVLFHYYYF